MNNVEFPSNYDEFDQSVEAVSDSMSCSQSDMDIDSLIAIWDFAETNGTMPIIHTQISLKHDDKCVDSKASCPTFAKLRMSAMMSQQYECESAYAELLEANTDTASISSMDSIELKAAKRMKVMQIIDSSILLKNIHFQRFYEPLRTDYRHVYPNLLFETVTSNNLPFLKQVLNSIVHEDCILCCGRAIEDNNSPLPKKLAKAKNRNDMWQISLLFSQMIPDLVFTCGDFKLYNLSHVPCTFKAIPVEFLGPDKTELLDEYLLNAAILNDEDLNPGTIIIGISNVRGTIIQPGLLDVDFPIVGKTREGFELTKFKDCFIFTLDDMGKIVRFESFTLPCNIIPVRDNWKEILRK